MADDWVAWRASRQEMAEQIEAFKKEMYGPRHAEQAFSMASCTVEQVVDTREELYQQK